MSSYFTSRRACAWIFMKIVFWMTIRMISTEFGVISDDLPDVTEATSHHHQKSHHQSKITSSPKTITKVDFSVLLQKRSLVGGRPGCPQALSWVEHHQPARVWTVPEALCGRWDIRYPVRTGHRVPECKGSWNVVEVTVKCEGYNYKFVMLQSMRTVML